MTFNIGSQNAGNINNVARDQHITGGQHGTLVTPDAARQAVIDLRAGLRVTPFDEGTSAAADADLTEIEASMHQPEPDRAQIAPRLERLTRLLVAAGSLAAAGSSLLQPLHTLATWLGALGRPILALLPALL